jgi:hypothetical protein
MISAILRFLFPLMEHSQINATRHPSASSFSIFLASAFWLPEIFFCQKSFLDEGHLNRWQSALDKYNRPEPGENEIGFSWQFSIVQPEPKSNFVKPRAYNKFRLCVLAFYTSHHLTALSGTDNIGHQAKSCFLFSKGISN